MQAGQTNQLALAQGDEGAVRMQASREERDGVAAAPQQGGELALEGVEEKVGGRSTPRRGQGANERESVQG